MRGHGARSAYLRWWPRAYLPEGHHSGLGALSAPPAVDDHQHGEEGGSVQQEDGCRASRGYHEAAEGRPNSPAYIDPHDVESNRGWELLAFDEIGDNGLPGWAVERDTQSHEAGKGQQGPGGHRSCQGEQAQGQSCEEQQ